MSPQPRLLDLYCCAGGAARGYQLAGFHVTGVDINPQPNYCGDEFIQGDAIEFVERYGGDFAAVHASPPCQRYLNLTRVNEKMGRKSNHPDLVGPTREAIRGSTWYQVPYVIENGPNAPLVDPVRLCGTAFDLPIRRHRHFESNVFLSGKACQHHLFSEQKYWTGWRPNGEHRLSSVVQVYGNAADKHEWPAAMGIDWATYDEIAEAIPPAYTQHVGYYLMSALADVEAAVGSGGEITQ